MVTISVVWCAENKLHVLINSSGREGLEGNLEVLTLDPRNSWNVTLRSS